VTAIYADALGAEERGIAARMWTQIGQGHFHAAWKLAYE
jgi:hypothetical protein